MTGKVDKGQLVVVDKNIKILNSPKNLLLNQILGVFYVLDSYALPVEGTETRVNAGNDAVEYMVNYRD